MPYHGEKQKTMKAPKLPHPMFMGGKMVMAKTLADHKRLEKMGYKHKK